ncbi:hypothetical protein EV421DRAFT_1824297 [Armillaria borealis]|uniref:Secreted protein n=1 Tax=Armillaria borealis TaxID=47425 RepID=A0AA39JDK1_9AGAR|nr:hypothetical protein EV421DRAFT_1824297 [Armillaria borealis]
MKAGWRGERIMKLINLGLVCSYLISPIRLADNDSKHFTGSATWHQVETMCSLASPSLHIRRHSLVDINRITWEPSPCHTENERY